MLNSWRHSQLFFSIYETFLSSLEVFSRSVLLQGTISFFLIAQAILPLLERYSPRLRQLLPSFLQDYLGGIA